jgi:hypothetical protein
MSHFPNLPCLTGVIIAKDISGCSSISPQNNLEQKTTDIKLQKTDKLNLKTLHTVLCTSIT